MIPETTPAELARYWDGGAVGCPRCGESWIETVESELGLDVAWETVQCNECGRMWTWEYRFTKVVAKFDVFAPAIMWRMRSPFRGWRLSAMVTYQPPPLVEDWSAFVLQKRCGCIRALVSNDPSYRKEAAKSVAQAIRDGLSVTMMTSEEIRKGEMKCPEHRAFQTKLVSE